MLRCIYQVHDPVQQGAQRVFRWGTAGYKRIGTDHSAYRSYGNKVAFNRQIFEGELEVPCQVANLLRSTIVCCHCKGFSAINSSGQHQEKLRPESTPARKTCTFPGHSGKAFLLPKGSAINSGQPSNNRTHVFHTTCIQAGVQNRRGGGGCLVTYLAILPRVQPGLTYLAISPDSPHWNTN